MMCTECKKEQKNAAQQNNFISSTDVSKADAKETIDEHTAVKAKRSATLILLSAAAVMLVMVFVLFWFIMLPNLPQSGSVLAEDNVNTVQTVNADTE